MKIAPVALIGVEVNDRTLTFAKLANTNTLSRLKVMYINGHEYITYQLSLREYLEQRNTGIFYIPEIGTKHIAVLLKMYDHGEEEEI